MHYQCYSIIVREGRRVRHKHERENLASVFQCMGRFVALGRIAFKYHVYYYLDYFVCVFFTDYT